MSVRSRTYRTQLPVPLSKGQMKEEDAITAPLPESMELTWDSNAQPSKSAIYQLSGRLPADFDARRDTLWFIACPNMQPRLVAEIGSQKKEIALQQLSDGKRWNGKSIYQACELCAQR